MTHTVNVAIRDSLGNQLFGFNSGDIVPVLKLKGAITQTISGNLHICISLVTPVKESLWTRIKRRLGRGRYDHSFPRDPNGVSFSRASRKAWLRQKSGNGRK